MPRLPVLLLAVLLAGCAEFPELDAAITPEARRAEYPSLLPLDQVLARREAVRITPRIEQDLLARAANLRARARLLRGVEVAEETRLRLAARLKALGG